MKNSHIAFIVFPHRCHVNPTVPIVATLARRGHRITYATGGQYAARMEVAGAEIVPYPDAHDSTEGDMLASLCRWMVRAPEALAQFYDRNHPDVIICDFIAVGAREWAHRRNIPIVQISPHFAYDRLYLHRQFRKIQHRDIFRDCVQKVNQHLENLGAPAADPYFHRENLNIFLFPKEFEPGDCSDERYFYAGRCAGEQPQFGCWKRPDHHPKPLVLVATSTSYVRGPEHFRMCIDALSGSEWHVVLSIGDEADPSVFGPLPSGFEIVQRTSHTRILPYAELLVYMGGTITAAEAAYHGVPLLMMSCGFTELEGLCDNLERLGIGVHLQESDMCAQNLRKAAAMIVNSGAIRDNVRRLQFRVRQSPGGEESANRIEEYIDERQMEAFS